MEGVKFLNILKRHKYSLLAIMLLIMAITFVFTRKLPDIYTSKGSLSAGLVEGSQTLMLDKSQLQESKLNQQFANLIQIMQMKKVYDQVSYLLILHDLTSHTPYKKTSKLFNNLNQDARQHAFEVFSERYKNRQPLSLWDQDENGLNTVLKSMGYDYDALSKKTKVYRIENSDFINVEYESDSPMLSAFVVNTLCSEFISYYRFLTKENEFSTIQFLDTLLQQKRDTLNTMVGGLKGFKIKNHVLNLNEQAKTLYSQKSDFETRIQMVEKEIKANEGALDGIRKKFGVTSNSYDSLQIKGNQKVINLKIQISLLMDKFARSNLDSNISVKIDSLKRVLQQEINQSTDRGSSNPQTAKDNLANQKLNLQINLELARGSIKSLNDELHRLNKRLDDMVPNEAEIQAYEGNINVASQEYIEIMKKYNQTSMAYNSSVQLKQTEIAMPSPPQPSKKMLLVVISGIGSLAMCILILFILFYLDDSVQFAEELANKTNFAVLGLLPLIRNTALLNLNKLWENDRANAENREFKKQLRSLRFETEDMMQGAHTLVVTSFTENEGKSFISLSLANAYIMVSKKVLLIDGNFNKPSITEITNASEYIEDYLNGKFNAPQSHYDNEITVLGNRGMDISLFEINNEKTIRERIEELKNMFDIIIIESSGLDTLNQSKEWISVSDKVLAVFECNKTISSAEKQYLAYLKSQHGKFLGWVFNKVKSKVAATGSKSIWFWKK